MKIGWYHILREGIRNLWSNRLMSFASVGVLVSVYAAQRRLGAAFAERRAP